MAFSCCAIGCANRQGKPNVKFYTFPKNPERKNRWIAAVRRKNWAPSRFSRICSEHFRNDLRFRNEVTFIKGCMLGIMKANNPNH
uniref:THAP-type domain-containing protein n=1 Tax=Amphimedon queenslandica TaxID=400682 RepID=A0A1X7VJM9_AMPQE